MRKLTNSKIAQGLASLIVIVVILSSILATSIFYGSNITANAVREDAIPIGNVPSVVEANDLKELSHLNEGWYQIKNGFVFYLETFDNSIPLYIHVRNLEQQNGLLAVDEDGNVKFDANANKLTEKEAVDEKRENHESQNQVTGEVTGLESVSGFATSVDFQSSSITVNGIKGTVIGVSVAEDRKIYRLDNGVYILVKKANNEYQTVQFVRGTVYRTDDGVFVNINPTTPTTSTPPPTPPVVAPSPVATPAPQTALPDPSGQKITGTTIPIVSSKPGQPPVVFSGSQIPLAEQGPQKIEQHAVQVGKNQYQMVTVYRLPDGSLSVSVNTANPESDKEQKITAWKIGDRVSASKFDPVVLPKDISQWNGYLNNIPLSGNGVRSASCDDNSCTTTDKYTVKDTKSGPDRTTKIEVTTTDRSDTIDKGNTVKTTTNYDADGVIIKSSTQTLTDKSFGKDVVITRTITAKDGTLVVDTTNGNLIDANIKSVVFQKGDSRLEVAPEAFLTIKNQNQDEKISTYFFEEARNRGITKIDKLNQQVDGFGGYYAGDRNGINVWINSDKIYSYEKTNLVGYIDRATGTTFSLIEGKATTEDKSLGKPVLLEGAIATVQVRNEKGIVTNDLLIQKIKGGTIEGEYINKDKNEIKVTIKYDAGEERTYTLSTITEKDSPYNGMTKIELGSDTYIIKETGFGTPFGIGQLLGIEGIFQLTAGGKEAKVTDHGLQKDLEAVKSNLDAKSKQTGGASSEQLSSQRFFANVERVFTEFQGLGYYATLFFDEDSLLKWRDNVDRAFATLYLGTEYWSSAICGTYINGENVGTAYAETPQGLAQVAAHIEATRTEPLITNNGTQFIYKLTFNIRNGDFEKDLRAPEQMNINVLLKGQRTVSLFRHPQTIKRGSTFGKVGINAIARRSKIFYNEICLTFDNTPLRWKVTGNQICNTIQESSGEPTTVANPAPSIPGGTGEEDDTFNDI